jgi:hypothetical protein
VSSTQERQPADNISQRRKAIDRGWLRESDDLLVPRLAFPLGSDSPEMVHEFNRAARDRIVADMLSGVALPTANPSRLGKEEHRVLGEVDRYNIPFRTVLGTSTGMLWADPYYSEEYLLHFFRE